MENTVRNEVVLKELLKASSALIDSSSSSSLSSEDELVSDKKNRRKRTRIENYVESVVQRYTDEEFKLHFRMKRSTAYKMIGLLSNSPYVPCHKDGREKICPNKIFLMVLWYLSNQDSFRGVSDRFNVTLSSAHRCLQRVLQYLLSIKANIIRWPTDEEAAVTVNAFYLKKGIPDVIGCIDGSHIEIPKPSEEQIAYVNRKGYHSILLQVIVDHNKKFIDVYCGEPGSIHDARLLRKSNIYATINNNPNYIGTKIVIGDSAYPNLHWLVTPFKDFGNLTRNQKEFNYKLSATRVIVENALGLLKGRFRRLRKLDNIDLSICSKIIMGACVLHNICIDESDLIETEVADFNQPINTNRSDGNTANADLSDNNNMNRQQVLFNLMYDRS